MADANGDSRAARAAVLERVGGPLELVDDLQVASPREGEVRVRITHCGVCHSDLHIIDGSLTFPLPVVPGHEAAGVVDRVGEGVRHLAEGDRVVLTCRPPCGTCYWCRRSEAFLCSGSTAWATGALEDGSTRLERGGETVYRGVGVGGFAEYVTIDANGAIAVPPDTPLDLAAVLGCAVQTGVGAVLNAARVQPGDTVLVVGLGGVGICIVQGACIAGAAKIVGVDPVEARREQAARFGLDVALDTAAAEEAVLELTGGIGVDHAFDAVASPSTTALCLAATRPGGTIVLVGVAEEGDVVAIPSRAYVGESKRLVGSFVGSANPHREFGLYLDLWKAGRLALDNLVTAVRPLGEVNEAFDDLRAASGLRTVLAVSEDAADYARGA
jgi:S-(hydroxymethyl)glutathione dehydrogenase/alcohol dehydrogenase